MLSPKKVAQPNPSYPINVVKTPHLHGAATTQETSFVKPEYKCLKRHKFGKRTEKKKQEKQTERKIGKMKQEMKNIEKRRKKEKRPPRGSSPRRLKKIVPRNREAIKAEKKSDFEHWRKEKEKENEKDEIEKKMRGKMKINRETNKRRKKQNKHEK